MANNLDSVTTLAVLILASVVSGTFMLIAIAFVRRGQQIRHARHIHSLQLRYRPALAKLLAGVRAPATVEALRELSIADLDLLLDPLFARRNLKDRQRVFLQALCSELGMVSLWQKRAANGHGAGPKPASQRAKEGRGRAAVRLLLRAKSIRNLGLLAHRPSGPLLAQALDDPHHDIQMVALRSLAAIGAPEGFDALQKRLQSVAKGEMDSPPLQPLLAAMSSFDLACVPALLPSLGHENRQIRLHSSDVLRMIVRREAMLDRSFSLGDDVLPAAMVELLVGQLALDGSAEIRARVAEVLVHLPAPRALRVLNNLLHDPQWFVRLRTLQALAQSPRTATFLRSEIRTFLRATTWQVREAAIGALISLGEEEKRELYEYYLSITDPAAREEIAEAIQRTGLMSDLVEDYSTGVGGVKALMVEELAKHPAATGLTGVVRNLDPERRQKFLERLLPMVHSNIRLPEIVRVATEGGNGLQPALEFPPHLAA